MVDLRELKLRNSKTCQCGHEFTANDIVELISNKDYQFYGGRVSFYSRVTCPKCSKEQVILLEPYNNTYRVIDIGELQDEMLANTEKDNVEHDDTLRCSKCNREFKSIQGLRMHQKSCQ